MAVSRCWCQHSTTNRWPSPTAELSFTDCPVPVENLLGDEDNGFQGVGKATLEWERAIMVAPDVLSLYFKDTPRRSHGLALDLAGAKLLAAYGAGVSGYYAGVEMADGFV